MPAITLLKRNTVTEVVIVTITLFLTISYVASSDSESLEQICHDIVLR